MAIESDAPPQVVQIGANGRLTLDRSTLHAAGLHEGEHVLLLTSNSGALYLHKITAPPTISREELSRIMRLAFEEEGYTNREKVLSLLREVREELAEEG